MILGNLKINGQLVTRRRATVWLYPNIPGRQEVAMAGRLPVRMEQRDRCLQAGCCPSCSPRLPLLGLPAFLANDLDWWLDPEQRQVTVQTRTWRRPLIRLLC